MAFEGNSHRGSSNRSEKPEPQEQRKSDGKHEGLIMSFLRNDSENIKEYLIETIVIPGIMDAIGGIGEIVLDSLTEAIGLVFERKGFSSDEKRRGGHTAYHKISKQKTNRHRFYKDDDDIDEGDDDERTYDNVRVKNEREAKDIINSLKDRIENQGYATVGDLFKEAGEIVTWADHQRCWTSLNSASWVRTRDRKKPWLLVFPKPKNISDLK